MPFPRKYPWPELKRRFLVGEWLTLKDAAAALGINYDVLKDRASKDNWIADRERLDADAEEAAKQRILARMTREYERSLVDRLRSAQAARVRGMQGLSDRVAKDGTVTPIVLTPSEALRAIEVAASIESDVFGGAGRRRPVEAKEAPQGDPLDATQEQTPEARRAELYGRLARLADAKKA